MGLTKQYLRYNPSSQFGVIASKRCNIVLLKYKNTTDRYAAVANCENVCVWDLKTNQRVVVLTGEGSEVSCMVSNPVSEQIAIGRTDGTVQIFDLVTGEDIVTFTGHKSPVSTLAYDKDGLRLASGSHDTEVVIWDLVDQKGLYRLKGHKGLITCCYFVKSHNMLITSSKDTYVKWWDLDTQHCFKTMVGHRAEVWKFVVTSNEDRLITGSVDSELRVWEIKFLNSEEKGDEDEDEDDTLSKNEEDEDLFEDRLVSCKKLGSILRKGLDRVVSLCLTTDNRYLICHGNKKLIEVFKILTEKELVEKQKKNLKKLKRKLADKVEESEIDSSLGLDQTIVENGVFYSSGKVASIDVAVSSKADCYVVTSLLRDNRIELVHMKPKIKEFITKSQTVSSGHRSESKSACFTSNNQQFVTTASQSAKLWNRASQQCIQTFKCDRPTCCLLAPGDLHLLLGTSSGNLQLYDIGSGDKLESYQVHKGGISCMSLLPSKMGLATGGSDKKVNFFEFDLVSDPNSSKLKQLQLVKLRTLELEEEVLDIAFTPDKQLVAVSLLDNSVLIFYADTLKFKLKLYEHSLPVNSISISTDSTLIVSGSKDRSVIIWGLDFGNRHSKLLAHDDDVTKVHFVPDTHLFFSCSKDGSIKQWDADKFILIQILQGHFSGVCFVAPSYDGDVILSAGQDLTLRLWQKTLEIVIPDEEREFKQGLEDEKEFANKLKVVHPGVEGSGESGLASKNTVETLKGAERIMEALELHREETIKELEFNKTQQRLKEDKVYRSTNVILMTYKIDSTTHVLRTIQSIKSSDLEESLLVIPFSYISDLLTLFNKFVLQSLEIELSCRCIFFLLRIHHGQITSSSSLIEIIHDLKKNVKKSVQKLRDRAGFNLAALNHIKREAELKEEVSIFADLTDAYKEKKKKKRKQDILQRSVLSV